MESTSDTTIAGPSPELLVEDYFTCWNTTDPAERRAAVERVWSPTARSVDPVGDARGHEELVALFAGFHDTYPGFSFRRRGGIDAHHDQLRWGWEMIDPGGDVVLDGVDVAERAHDGRLDRLAGFFGRDVAAAD